MMRGIGAASRWRENRFRGHAHRRTAKDGLFPELCQAFQGPGAVQRGRQVCASDFVVAGYLSTTLFGTRGRANLLEIRNSGVLRASGGGMIIRAGGVMCAPRTVQHRRPDCGGDTTLVRNTSSKRGQGQLII